MASQITCVSIVYSTVCSGTDQRNIKAARHWPLWLESTGDWWFSSQRASNVEKTSIWWRHHDAETSQVFKILDVPELVKQGARASVAMVLTFFSTAIFVISGVNSLWPSDAIWRQWSGSTLAQVMACCLKASSHYLNQCWLIISRVLWLSWEGNFIRDTTTMNH